jgi:hypothetical protein
MDDHFFFMVHSIEWQQQSYYESEDYPASFLVAVTEGGISKPLFKPVLQSTKKCTHPNVYQYFINLSKNT